MPKKPKALPPEKYPLFPLILFTAVSLLCACGLDYIAWSRGEQTVLFSSLLGSKIPKEIIPLPQTVLSNLTALDIPSESISLYADEKGVSHMLVDLSHEKFNQIRSLLEQEFKKTDIKIIKKQEQLNDERNYYFWELEGNQKQKLHVLFSCLKTIEPVQDKPPKKKAAAKREKGKAAIIIDDMGYNLRAINRLINLKKPVTVAVLPFSPFADETARIAHENELEVILHLPLESINADEESPESEGFIHSGMNDEDIVSMVERGISQVPYAIGVNNHMGSKITSDEHIMQVILNQLKGKNLFFVDSRTTGGTVAFEIARSLNIPTTSRNVFLDGIAQKEYIKNQLFLLFRLAQQNGQAVGICHPYDETLATLKSHLYHADEFNVELVFVSGLVR